MCVHYSHCLWRSSLQIISLRTWVLGSEVKFGSCPYQFVLTTKGNYQSKEYFNGMVSSLYEHLCYVLPTYWE